MPAETPVTIPVDEPTDAMDALLVDHVPPETASLIVMLLPTARVVMPEMGSAAGLTVTVMVAELAPTVYEIMHVPAAAPVTTPLDEPTVAIEILLLLQCPPAVESDKVVVEPAHRLSMPLMP